MTTTTSDGIISGTYLQVQVLIAECSQPVLTFLHSFQASMQCLVNEGITATQEALSDIVAQLKNKW